MGDFREYMRMKIEKLHEQFSEQKREAQKNDGGIFKGVRIWVNGFTRPSHLVCNNLKAPQ
jgi:DNA repair protein REV1